MRHNPDYLLDDHTRIRALIRENPWATLVSDGLTASHLPVLLEDGPGLSVVGHLGRPDDELHKLGEREALLIVAGPNGYISPGWYGSGPAVPTWNYLAVHLYGRPEVLSPEETYQVLVDTVDRFEHVLPAPYQMDQSYARRIAPGVAGFRLRAERVEGKAKLSQDKTPQIAHNIIRALDADPSYANPALAREMREVWTPEETR
ncbi:FMN-binding negative transcriptional regulator [Nonomuraea endophytica]|uniref:FMN-binding negative transcriptional regulator n=1 Tax=Nonomuraea endophytica TaxID=714136 RepID=UPI0037CA488D